MHKIKWTTPFYFIIDNLMESAPRFLCDVMLARLARYLRAAGLDTTLAVESATDAQILRIAIDEGRWLLTADRKITEHKAAKGRVIQLPFGTLDLQAGSPERTIRHRLAQSRLHPLPDGQHPAPTRHPGTRTASAGRCPRTAG